MGYPLFDTQELGVQIPGRTAENETYLIIQSIIKQFLEKCYFLVNKATKMKFGKILVSIFIK